MALMIRTSGSYSEWVTERRALMDARRRPQGNPVVEQACRKAAATETTKGAIRSAWRRALVLAFLLALVPSLTFAAHRFPGQTCTATCAKKLQLKLNSFNYATNPDRGDGPAHLQLVLIDGSAVDIVGTCALQEDQVESGVQLQLNFVANCFVPRKYPLAGWHYGSDRKLKLDLATSGQLVFDDGACQIYSVK
jgi:hypothetical protein